MGSLAAAASSYSSTDGGECQYVATKTKTTSLTKRKRTKRGLLRSFSSPPPAPPDEEEEDMAHCLILLAQGPTAAAGCSSLPSPPRELGACVYECKTCNKCFPSFQALGGHRASHKKPKPAVASTSVMVDIDRADGCALEIGMNSSSPPPLLRVKQPASSTPPPPAVPANKLRVHECSICGSEFASGQALGGHMRRHRPVLGGAAAAAAAAPDSPRELAANGSSGGVSSKEEKKCSMLSLDLNLPAPPEEINGNSVADAFAFVDRRPLALVDCHY